MNFEEKHNYGIDACRIFSMMLIVFYHLSRYSKNFASLPNSFYNVESILLGSWGIVGVDLFIMISSWFLINKHFKVQKVLKLCIELVCYISIFLSIAFIMQCIQNGLLEGIKFLILYIFNALLEPLFSEHYWFMNTYIVFYCTVPFMNSIIKIMSNDVLKRVVIIFSFIPFYYNYMIDFSLATDVIYFMYVYFLIALLRRNKNNFIERNALLGSISMFLIILLSILFERFIFYKMRFGFIIEPIIRLTTNTGRHSLCMLIFSLFLFYLFKNMKFKFNLFTKYINIVAKYTLGVYLFHENKAYLMIEKIAFFIDSFNWENTLFIFEYLLIACIIFVFGIICEFILLKIIIDPFAQRISKKYNEKFIRANSWFNNKIYYIREL